jgi:hypothetical protein
MMKVAVWDTYVTKKDGTVMHFDIIAPENIKDAEKIYTFGREYLASKGQAGQKLATKECAFCHIEQLPVDKEQIVKEKGYYIIEMQGCN